MLDDVHERLLSSFDNEVLIDYNLLSLSKVIPFVDFLFNWLTVFPMLVRNPLFLLLLHQNIGFYFTQIKDFFCLLKFWGCLDVLGYKILLLDFLNIFFHIFSIKTEFFEGFYTQFAFFSLYWITFNLFGLIKLNQVLIEVIFDIEIWNFLY